MKICPNNHKQIPLIRTFAFRGCEYRCPYCGDGGGMFGFGREVVGNIRLHRLLEYYKKRTKKYLAAAAMVNGAERRDKYGKYKGIKEYPLNIQSRRRNLCSKKLNEL